MKKIIKQNYEKPVVNFVVIAVNQQVIAASGHEGFEYEDL